jgi:transcriptional regulator with XRE-family HTH domain
MENRVVSSGVPSLDEYLGGGLVGGDNLVWFTDDLDAVDPFCQAFAAVEPDDCVWLSFGTTSNCSVTGVRLVGLSVDAVVADPEAVIAQILEEARDRPRLVITDFDELFIRCGASVAADFYRQTCPRLFDMGAVAVWPSDRSVLASSVATQMSQIAQCVFELRSDTFRVVKADGRPPSVQGALAELHDDGRGAPVIGRELVVGRLGEGLRRLRHERNLTHKQVAGIAGVTPGAISQAEAGRRGLSLETLVPMCEQLGIGLDELLGTRRPRPHILARRDRRPLDDETTVLFDDPDLGTRAYRIELAPRQEVAPPFAHKGIEMVLVSRGLVMVDLGSDTPVMRAGDALMVTADPVRSWSNLGPGAAELFWVVVSVNIRTLPDEV